VDKEWIEGCVRRYKLLESKNPGQNDATLPRILAIFSHAVVLGVARGEFEPPITPTKIENPENKFIPRAVLCSVFGSMIPESTPLFPPEDRQLLVTAWMYHQYKYDRFINTVSNYSPKDTLIQYAKIQIDQQFHHNARHLHVMSKSGLFTEDLKLCEGVRPGLLHLKNLWENIQW
jgi:hypothetical protein